MTFDDDAHRLLYPETYDGSTQHERIAAALQRAYAAGLERAEALVRAREKRWADNVPGLAIIDEAEGSAAGWFAQITKEAADLIAAERKPAPRTTDGNG